MIINVRGTSGSGKTYAVRRMMEQLDGDLLVYSEGDFFREGKVIAHCLHHRMQPVYVIGNYSSNVCGGCDTIGTQNLVCSTVRHFAQFGHVVFEGLIISHLFARYVALSKEFEAYGEHMVFVYLDTPIELCLDRVRQRRLAAGNTKPLDPTNTISKHESVHTCFDKMQEAGMDVRWMKHDGDVASQLLAMLNEWPFANSYKEQSFR